MTITEYYNKINKSPGGIPYFYSWIKYHTSDNEHYKVNIINNYFQKPEDERGKINKKAEIIFSNNAEKYISEYLPKVENDLGERRSLKKLIKVSYFKIKELAGGYYGFYGWIRENYPGLKSRGYSETTIRNAIYDINEKRFINDYVKFGTTFINLVEEYLIVKEQNGFIYESEVNNIPNEILTSFHQYFLFFSDYLKSNNKLDIDFKIIKVDKGLKFKIITEKENDISIIKSHLDEYLLIAKNVIVDGLNLDDVLKKLNLLEINKLRLETELSHLQNTLRIAEFENKQLNNTSEYLKTLAMTLAKNSPTITNQVIADGNQQFADRIDNNSEL